MTNSPCNNVCRLNTQQVCVGCGRHIDEIIAWSTATEATKRAIVEAARQRLSIISVAPTTRPDDSSKTQ